MANRIRFLRNEMGLTQTELGAHFNLSKTAISYYENSQRDIGDDLLKRLADFFQVSTDYLLCRTDRRHVLPPVEIESQDGKTKTVTYATDIPLESERLQEHWNDLYQQFKQIIESGALNEEQARYWLESTKTDLDRTIKMIESTKKDK